MAQYKDYKAPLISQKLDERIGSLLSHSDTPREVRKVAVALNVAKKTGFLSGVTIQSYSSYDDYIRMDFVDGRDLRSGRVILALLGDFGSHILYREAQGKWNNQKWVPRRGGRPSLKMDLKNARHSWALELRRKPELMQLSVLVKKVLGQDWSYKEIAEILFFTQLRHSSSHADITEESSLPPVLKIVDNAIQSCQVCWPPNMEDYRNTMSKVTKYYKTLVEEIMEYHGSAEYSKEVDEALWTKGGSSGKPQFTAALWSYRRARFSLDENGDLRAAPA